MKPSRGLHPRNRHESPANGGISIAQLAFAQYSVIRAIARVTASITRSARKRANRFRAIESHVLQVAGKFCYYAIARRYKRVEQIYRQYLSILSAP